MTRAKQPIPLAAGGLRSGTDRRGRRIGTAPLRRYIDGLAQRQALSALCGYGVPLTVDECWEASKTAARASENSNNNNIQFQLSLDNIRKINLKLNSFSFKLILFLIFYYLIVFLKKKLISSNKVFKLNYKVG